jgi:hypothetical protein
MTIQGKHLVYAFALAVVANIVAKIIVDRMMTRTPAKLLQFPTASGGCGCGG